MSKRFALLLSLALLVVTAVAAQQAPIKIGAILPLTGSGASYGVWMKGGTEMAAEEINAAGGIAGRKLEVIYEDHAADASKAVNAMRRLVEVEKVPFTLTSYSSPTLAVQPIGAQSKVVMMNGGGQSDNLANKDYLYNNIPVVSNEVGVLVRLAHQGEEVQDRGHDRGQRRGGPQRGEVLPRALHGGRGQGAGRGADRARRQRLPRPARQAARPRAAICCSSPRTGATWRSWPTRRASSASRSRSRRTSWVQIPEVLKAKGAQGMLTTRLPFNPDSPFATQVQGALQDRRRLLRRAVLQRAPASSRWPRRRR